MTRRSVFRLVRSPQLVLCGLALAAPAAAQSSGDWVRLPEAREIALARSAAPPAVSDHATIWVMRDGVFQVAVRGSNGNACMVSRTHATSLEPICYDSEGARTIQPIERRLVELRIRTGDWNAAWEEVHRAIAAGELPLPGRPSMAYMLSSAQRLVADDGREVGAWHPHFMMYVPYATSEQMGLFGQSPVVLVAHEGEPLASVITVAPEFVDPDEGG